MLEKPDLQDALIIARLRTEYGLDVSQLIFLPLGADVNTAVYRVTVRDGSDYFLKLRSGNFEEITLAVPKFLAAQGIRAIIPPLVSQKNQAWAELDAFKMVLYPFIEGQNGYKVALSDRQWVEFGAALKGIHTAPVPPMLAPLIPRETFPPLWREMVRTFQARIETTPYEDPVAAQVAALMKARRAEIDFLVERTEELAFILQARPLEMVLCHSDIHAGNLLICENGALYIVDWDNPSLAPKERDLQLIGGSTRWNRLHDADLFYQGYGPTEIDRQALAYYRYERIIEDIAAYCQQLLASSEGGKDREQSLIYFTSNFLPDHEIEIATRLDMP